MLHLEALQLIIAYLLFRDYPVFADMLPGLPCTVRRALAAFNAYFSCENRQERCVTPEACGSCERENAGNDAVLSTLCELLGSAESSSTASLLSSLMSKGSAGSSFDPLSLLLCLASRQNAAAPPFDSCKSAGSAPTSNGCGCADNSGESFSRPDDGCECETAKTKSPRGFSREQENFFKRYIPEK